MRASAVLCRVAARAARGHVVAIAHDVKGLPSETSVGKASTWLAMVALVTACHLVISTATPDYH
jgi:hypothetical protein